MMELDQVLEHGKNVGIGLVAGEAVAYLLKGAIHLSLHKFSDKFNDIIRDPDYYKRIMYTPITYYLFSETWKSAKQFLEVLRKYNSQTKI